MSTQCDRANPHNGRWVPPTDGGAHVKTDHAKQGDGPPSPFLYSGFGDSAIMLSGATETLDDTCDGVRLRPFRAGDAAALQTICAGWRMARMTSRIPHPYPARAAPRRIAEREALAESGRGISFCLDSGGLMTGAVTLRHQGHRRYELGYSNGDTEGQGFATAAAQQASGYAFAALSAKSVCVRHYFDNPASQRVLEKCSFRYTGSDWQWCQARQQLVPCRRYLLQAAGA